MRWAGILLAALVPALLGYALWRVERHRPVWLAPSLWQLSPPAAPVSPAIRPRVLAFHYAWYGTSDGPTGRWRHWNHPRRAQPDDRILGFHDPRRAAPGRRRDLGSTHDPAPDAYDSRDPQTIARQLSQAREAGLDGFVVSWWGRESPEARTFALLLGAAREAGLVLAPYYEAGELGPRAGPGVAADLEAFLDRHGGDPALLRVGELPVVFVYGAQRLRPGGWEYVRRRLRAGRRPVYLVGDSPRPRWLPLFDAVHVSTPIPFLARHRELTQVYREWHGVAQAAGLPFIPAVAPGFDDRTVRHPGTLVPRRDGATYDETWQAALAVRPAWVVIASWNEWHEGSEIEPSLEHGRRYLEATRRWATRFRTLEP